MTPENDPLAPLRRSIRVRCSVEHAFEVWTKGISAWWPLRGHSVSGENAEAVLLEPRAGGRFYERARDGSEHEWGRILVWEPPHRLVYSWHIGSDPARATEVEIRFTGAADGATEVAIEHRGWERWAEAAPKARRANEAGWDDLLPAYVAACGA